jgi:DNA-binding MarR family transcriptional regulator
MSTGRIERIAYLFAQAAGKFNRIQETPVSLEDGTTVYGSEMHMAVAVGEGRARTATELGELFSVTRGAVSQAVKRLEAKGILKRRPAPEDAKRLIIELTDKGRELEALHARLHGVNEAEVEAAVAEFGAEKLAAAEEFLVAVSAIIDALAERTKGGPR